MDLIGERRRSADVEKGTLEIGGQSRGGHSPPEGKEERRVGFLSSEAGEKGGGKRWREWIWLGIGGGGKGGN